MIIQSVERAFAILEYLSDHGGSARLNDIARAISLQKTTTHNLMDTLKKLGYVEQRDGSPRYLISDKFASLHTPLCTIPEIQQLVKESLEKLSEELGLYTFLALQSGSYFHYNLVIAPQGMLPSMLETGKDQEMFHTAVGKIFIAFSPSLEQSLRKYYPGCINKTMAKELGQIRESNYARDNEDYRPGQNCIALPLLYRRQVIGVLGAYGDSLHFHPAAMDSAILRFSKEIDRIKMKM